MKEPLANTDTATPHVAATARADVVGIGSTPIHSNDKLYQCHCSRRFSRLYDLMRHQGTDHNEDISGESWRRKSRSPPPRPPSSPIAPPDDRRSAGHITPPIPFEADSPPRAAMLGSYHDLNTPFIDPDGLTNEYRYTHITPY